MKRQRSDFRIRVFDLRGWLPMLLLAVAAGCAADKPPLGTWEGPKTEATVKEEPWTYQSRPGKKIITPHYVIYSTLTDEELNQSVAQLMEGALEQYHRMSPAVSASTKPMDCYIFANRTEWADYTRKVTGADSKVYLQITRGGYAIGDQFVAFFLGDHGTFSVAAHEGWHQYVARNFKGRIPPFLEEGIACMFENVSWSGDLPRFNLSINAARTQALRHSIESKELWPLAELCTMHAGQIVHLPPERIEAFYAENWAFARFLWEGDAGKHRPAFQALLADTARGVLRDGKGGHRPFENNWNPSIVQPTLEIYLGMTIEEIDTAFQAFMRKVAYDEFRDQWQL